MNELRESHRCPAKKTSAQISISEGDAIIVHDNTLPHGLWKLGQIEEVLTGSDQKYIIEGRRERIILPVYVIATQTAKSHDRWHPYNFINDRNL